MGWWMYHSSCQPTHISYICRYLHAWDGGAQTRQTIPTTHNFRCKGRISQPFCGPLQLHTTRGLHTDTASPDHPLCANHRAPHPSTTPTILLTLSHLQPIQPTTHHITNPFVCTTSTCRFLAHRQQRHWHRKTYSLAIPSWNATKAVESN